MASAPRLLLALPAMALAVWMAVAGARWVFLDLTYAATEAELSFWGRETYQPTRIKVSLAERRLARLLQHQPANPNYQALQAYFWSWQGFFSTDMDQRLTFNQRAVDAQYAAATPPPAWIRSLTRTRTRTRPSLSHNTLRRR